jgi:hypothetical protein
VHAGSLGSANVPLGARYHCGDQRRLDCRELRLASDSRKDRSQRLLAMEGD